MRVIARRTLREFLESRAGRPDYHALKSPVNAWFAEVTAAKWATPAAIKAQFRSASILSSDRVVFNIRGNAYRLVAAVDFERSIVWIKWIGTHSEYDLVDAKEVTYARKR